MYDSIVVGSGIAGSTAARKLAEHGNRKVLVIEKRNHVGGNCYDCLDEHGIMIHKYGPHIFHTGIKEVYDFLSRFTTWTEFRHEVVAKVGKQLLPVPFNLNTLSMVFTKDVAKKLEEKLIDIYGYGNKVPIMELRKNKDEEVRSIAEFVYENIFLKYTMKQWGQTPEEISPEVTGRVPISISHDNGYFTDPYQGVPDDGFSAMFHRMLDHPNITVLLGTDAKKRLKLEKQQIFWNGTLFTGEIIYTGAVDELFDVCFGRLPYRSLDFKFEHYGEPSYQDRSVVNYTVSEDFTRITEFKFLTRQKKTNGTTIVKEYPFAYGAKEGEIPYYAILNDENRALYERYRELANAYPQFYLLGRLAEYQYYNIDAMTKKALDLAVDIIEEKNQ
ncbi:MAG: UDP-galactopyranose mutase [Lachnospiraceae bacterium]|nr:UDP-galactopyranose mutase [Lachnospiraceae bacterium]